MRLLHNAVDFSLPCFPVYPIRGLAGILLLISNTAHSAVRRAMPFLHWE